MALNFVGNPYSYYNNRNKTGPLFNGFIYVGEPDLDPTIIVNQKTVTAKQEDGTQVPIPQPIRTNSGGYAVDAGGNLVVLLVDGNYSIRVNDKQGNLALEQADVNDGAPLTTEDIRSRSFDSLTSAIAFVTANPTTIDRLTTASYRNEAECLALSIDYPDGGGADYIVAASGTGTPDGGSFINAGSVQLQLNTTKVNILQFGAVRGNVNSFDSYQAIASALLFSDFVRAPEGVYYLSEGITLTQGKVLYGDGIDFWDTFRQSRILKSISHGTHFLFTGTGAKNNTCINLPNVQAPKLIGGFTFDFTNFTNLDSVSGAPATARPFSVAVQMNEDSQLKDIRIAPDFDGIDGYLNTSTQTIGAQWDVGIWCQAANEAIIDNVQAVGYWLMAGTLVTENNGTYEQIANPERLRVSKLATQGIRGLLVRNSPQWEVLSNTSTEITVQYNSSWTLTTQNKFRILGSTTKFEFTGYTQTTPGEIVLTGVTPNLPVGVTILRSPSQGNNLNGTTFDDSYCSSLEHSSGVASQDLPALGLPIAGGFEIDGFPLRGLKFKNTKFQTVYDELNSLIGDARDMQWVQCQTEGGELIAYNSDQSPVAMTENFRVVSTQLNPHGLTGFTPRELYDDNRMFPTQFTDGATIIRPALDEKDLIVEDFAGQALWQARYSDGYITSTSYTGKLYQRFNGTSEAHDLWGEGMALRRLSDGAAFLEFFSGSGNAATMANFTIGGEAIIAGGSVRPKVDAAADVGSVPFRFANAYVDAIKMRSPNGTTWTVTVDNAGVLVVV